MSLRLIGIHGNKKTRPIDINGSCVKDQLRVAGQAQQEIFRWREKEKVGDVRHVFVCCWFLVCLFSSIYRSCLFVCRIVFLIVYLLVVCVCVCFFFYLFVLSVCLSACFLSACLPTAILLSCFFVFFHIFLFFIKFSFSILLQTKILRSIIKNSVISSCTFKDTICMPRHQVPQCQEILPSLKVNHSPLCLMGDVCSLPITCMVPEWAR